MKPFIFIKHNLPAKTGSKVFLSIMLLIGIIFMVLTLLFTAVFLVIGLPVLGIALYRAIRFRKRLNNIDIGVEDYKRKVIEAEEWKVIEDK